MKDGLHGENLLRDRDVTRIFLRSLAPLANTLPKNATHPLVAPALLPQQWPGWSLTSLPGPAWGCSTS